MGIDLHTSRFLFEAKRTGVDFSEALTLGRQHLHIDKQTYTREAKRFGLAVCPNVFSDPPFAEGLLVALGARSPGSLDASPYEGATHIADMNGPLPESLHGRFSAVIDGGTIEHIFDIRQTVLNISKLLRVGGHLISVTCANNFVGHGFYQFSPELFYRAFSAENGFEVEAVYLTEVNVDGAWYEAADPARVGGRVTLVNSSRTYIMTRARKTADVEMFRNPPQQSDYHDARWLESEETVRSATLSSSGGIQKTIEQRFPPFARRALRRTKQAVTNHFSSPHLKLVRTF